MQHWRAPRPPAVSAAPGALLPEVTLLLAVKDGARYLPAQLDSFDAQKGVRWRLLASDDGSTDGSSTILRGFAARHRGRVALIDGPRRGAAQNFLHLLRHAPGAGFIAFSDQDDVWLSGKLARAIARLGSARDPVPRLYCSRTIICGRDLSPRGFSPRFCRPPSFRNALAQCIGGGNTMVMNPAALRLAQAAAAATGDIVMHDWWLYQLVSGAGGRVIHDPEPQLHYRQHGQNLVGSNRSVPARLRRLRMLACGVLRDWNETNIAALRASAHLLTEENRVVLEAFAAARLAPRRQRRAALRRLGLYRQTSAGSFAYACAGMAGLL